MQQRQASSQRARCDGIFLPDLPSRMGLDTATILRDIFVSSLKGFRYMRISEPSLLTGSASRVMNGGSIRTKLKAPRSACRRRRSTRPEEQERCHCLRQILWLVEIIENKAW